MTTATSPSILSFSRAHVLAAKQRKRLYWWIEIVAAVLAIAASLSPWLRIAAVLGVLAVAAKVASKILVSSARRLFRTGERQRRYDFYGRTLAWPVPATDRADMSIANASGSIKKLAAGLAPRESDYYAHQGPASTEALFCSLTESMFWTERLMGGMAKVRRGHFAIAATAVVAVLVGTVISEPAEHGLLVLKYLGAVVALLVSVDVLGEAQSFGRGERETGKLLNAMLNEMARPNRSRDEALRLLVEYNCLLADLPMLPEGFYDKKRTVLNEAWTDFEASLPIRCRTQEPTAS